MFKFLRKYKGWLLGVFGTLLLIVFLVPQAISGIAQYSATTGGTWATVGKDAETVTFKTLDRLQRELRVLQAVGNPTINALGADRSPEHWYLLRREAEQAGLHGGAGDGRSVLAGLTGQINQQRLANDPAAQALTEDDVLGILCQNSASSPQDVLETLARLAGVTRLTNLFAGLDRFSDRRLEREAAEMMLGVAADLVVLDPAKGPGASAIEADEAALAAHFAEFAAVEPGTGDLGFGYRRPDRFKLEWMAIPSAAIRDSVSTGGDLDILTLKRRFAENPAAFGVAAATSSDRPRFDDYADQVRSVVLEEVSSKRLDDLAKSLSDRFAASQRVLTRSGDGLYLIDERWSERMPGFDEIAAEVSTAQKIPTPEIGSSGEQWFTLADLDTIAVLSRATTDRFGTTPLRVRDLVQAAREFGGEASLPIQVGIASPVMTNPAGDLVVFRLLAVEPSAPETDLEAVRETVVADLTRRLAYDRLAERLPQLRDQAIADGLRSVAREFDTSVEFVPMIREADPQFLQSGFRVSSNLPGGIGRDQEIVSEIVQNAMKLPFGRPVAELPESDRVFTVADPDRLIAAIVRVTDVLPLVREVFEPLAADARFQATFMGNEFGGELVEMFGLEALTGRHGFARVATPGQNDEEFVEDDLAETSAS
ncbi:MAG: hypothetical protein ACO3EP_03645 [Phycisphaerales bacterium]